MSQLHPAGYRGVVVCNNDMYGSSQSRVGTAKMSINIIDISNVYYGSTITRHGRQMPRHITNTVIQGMT